MQILGKQLGPSLSQHPSVAPVNPLDWKIASTDTTLTSFSRNGEDRAEPPPRQTSARIDTVIAP
jgi:hypothetical protein